MKNLKKMSRENLKEIMGGAPINACKTYPAQWCYDSCGACVRCDLLHWAEC